MPKCRNRGGGLRRFILLALATAMLGAAACDGGDSRPLIPPGADTPTATSTSLATTSTAAPSAVATPKPGNDALRSANETLREGRYDAAALAFAAIASTTRDATRAEALIGLSLARFQEGDRDAAIVALKDALTAAPPASVEAIRAGYLLGVRLNEAGRHGEAVTVLAGVIGSTSGVPLAPYFAAEHARALALDGRGAEAAIAWDALLASPGADAALTASVWRERANVARKDGDEASLARALDQLISTTGESAAMYERATLAREARETDRFVTLLREIVSSHSGAKEAPLAVADLHDAGIAVDPGQEGLIYYRRGAYQEARRVLLPAVQEPGLALTTLVFRLYYLAAAYEDAGLDAEAVRYYDQAAAVGANSPYTHRAMYWAARVTEGRGDDLGAADRYAAIVRDGPAGQFSAEAAFRSGYALLAAGDAAAALLRWDAVGSTGGARVAYWKGRALEQLGRKDEANSSYRAAMALGPADFYGIEAARKLGERKGLDVGYRKRELAKPVDWAAIRTWLEGRIGGAPSGSPRTAAAELAAVGLRREAAAAIELSARGAGAWRLLELAEEAYSAGLVDISARYAVRIRELAGVKSHDAPPDLLRVAYPVDYVAQIDAQAKENGIDPLFLAAMVRQESFWDAAAGSHAGALGLTQVIPPTGEGIAAALGVKGFEAEDLFRPGVSLRFGAYYLGGQLKRFGNPLYALSAYNAGPGNALRWVERVGKGGPADFVEAVDIDETKHYVAVILEHYAHYELAFGGD